MKTIKNIITGILSVAVFFIAVQVSMAAEKSVPGEKVMVANVQQQDTLWIPITITDTDEPEEAENQRVEAEPTANLPGDCQPDNLGEICAVRLNFSNADEDEIEELLDLLKDNDASNNPTIQDFLDADAEYTGQSTTPVFARHP